MDKTGYAQIIALAVVGLVVAGLYVRKRWVYRATGTFVVPPGPPALEQAQQPALASGPAATPTDETADEEEAATTAELSPVVTEQPADPQVGAPAPGVAVTYWHGDVVPASVAARFSDKCGRQQRTWLAAIIVGKDNRTSTSKTVAFVWTLAIVWGLLSLLIAFWLGDDAGWKEQSTLDLQDEYLLLLGGPFAAAVLAKAVTSARTDTKVEGDPADTSAAQIVTDDAGDAELGDLQYALFNLVALLFFIGAFVQDPDAGFPELPNLLTGLALASATGYTAKKFLKEAVPKMTSVVPPKAAPDGEIQIFGSALTVSADASESGAALPPTVTVGGKVVPVTAQDRVLGNDRLTLKLPTTIAVGSAPIAVTRADGAAASTPTGENVLAFEITA